MSSMTDSLAFSNPSKGLLAPDWAVGQANRRSDLDVWPGFQKPPSGFGVVPFFWWLGDPLTKERLGWILEQMDGYGISGYQINYSHGYQDGGLNYGLTMPSEPPLFSEEWWELVDWFMQEAKKQNASISLSDYTLGIGQGWILDAILKERPDMTGTTLQMVDGRIEGALSCLEITDRSGSNRLVSVIAVNNPLSLDPMHPESGIVYAEKFFGQFEQRFPDEVGKGLNFFFSDELGFGVNGFLWNGQFADEFLKRKGYNIVPELAALFADIGPRTPKIRMDFSDVMTGLTEEGFFKPVYDWHQKRGMIMGCDHGGRGLDVVEFGDYFRTQRWNQGPGADQPDLNIDLIKAKVASSMAHLYQRPRVWLEGFHSSGWGTSSEGLIDATFVNFVMGFNLLSLHGMYYSTHGGWWEWAPPDNTFRMPYWKHMKGFMDCIQRLSYLFTQGTHVCDVAIMYPVSPMEAGMNGEEAVKVAFDSARKLYERSIDFDFMDFHSLERAQIVGKELQVSGESFKILVLPSMTALRHSTLKKALEFKQAGGIVLAVGALPQASDRFGLDDPELLEMVEALFPDGLSEDVVETILKGLPVLDYQGPGYIQHRKLGSRDLYAIYNAPQGSEVVFRATGRVELWDPWTGASRPLAIVSQENGLTKLKLPLTEKEIQLVVFSEGHPEIAETNHCDEPPQIIAVEGDWEFELQPSSDNRFGDFHWPPTQTLIGAEARQVWYCESSTPTGPWRKVTTSFGPRFIKCSTKPDLLSITPPQGGTICEFSWRWGIENDPGLQGYHGLKEKVHDDIITIGKIKVGSWGDSYTAEDEDSYFWTTIVSHCDMIASIHCGQIKPLKIWVNGTEVSGKTVQLKAGANPLVLLYSKDAPGRTYFVVSTSEPIETEPAPDWFLDGQQPIFEVSSLTAKWAEDQGLLQFDIRPDEEKPVGWYRFVSPPGLRSLTVKASGDIQVSINDELFENTGTGIFTLPVPNANPMTVLIRVEQERGQYGGATLLEPIKLDCGIGRFGLGDWSENEGLASYSGGAWYRKCIHIPAGKKVVLDLGTLTASAELKVNGATVGIKVAPPWTFDISRFVKPGDNHLEILVYNTLANHYCTVPTKYRGSARSGLLGPVQLIVSN